jgi:hypothetical protein
MNNIFKLTAILSILIITSCKKDRTCVCEKDDGTITKEIIPDVTKNEASNYCNSGAYTDEAGNTIGQSTCKIE